MRWRSKGLKGGGELGSTSRLAQREYFNFRSSDDTCFGIDHARTTNPHAAVQYELYRVILRIPKLHC
jgi:hypothetical protein